MKAILTAVTLLFLAFTLHAGETEKTIQEMRDEIAQLKRALVKAQEQSVTNFASAVEFRNKFELAVQRINEANEVAKQWRGLSVNLQRELSYTRALADGTAPVESQSLVASTAAMQESLATGKTLKVPGAVTASAVRTSGPRLAIIPRDAVAPTYVAMR